MLSLHIWKGISPKQHWTNQKCQCGKDFIGSSCLPPCWLWYSLRMTIPSGQDTGESFWVLPDAPTDCSAKPMAVVSYSVRLWFHHVAKNTGREHGIEQKSLCKYLTTRSPRPSSQTSPAQLGSKNRAGHPFPQPYHTLTSTAPPGH